MKHFAFAILCMIMSVKGFSQNSFGIEFGIYSVDQFSEVQVFDSIIVAPSNFEPYNDTFFGLFYEHQFSNRFSLHQKLNLTRPYNSYVYFNQNVEGVGGQLVVKAGGPRVNRLSWELLPQFTLIDFRTLKIRAFAGINFSANIVLNDPDLDFRFFPGVSKVGNAIGPAQTPYTLNFAYGGSVEFGKRFMFWAKWQPRSYYSREIEIDGRPYPFENQWRFFSMSIGYKFYSFKLKNSLKLQ